jgi:hypothetical protein
MPLVFMAASMKIRAFWYVAPCSLVGVDRCFSGDYHRDDGGSMRLWNVGLLLQGYGVTF